MAEKAPLITAIEEGDVDEVIRLIAKQADANACDDLGETPLMCVRWDKPHARDIVGMLLEAGADINARGTLIGGTCLARAAQGNDPSAVQYLIDLGADVNVRMCDENYNQSTALHWAALFSQNPKIIEILLDNGADPNAPGLLGQMPLHEAVTSSRKWYSGEHLDKTGVIAALLKGGAKVDARDGMGRTPLMAMADTNPSPLLASLLLAQKNNVNDKDSYAETALHIAARNGYADFVDFLLKNGADPVKRDSKGKTPLMAMLDFNAAASREGSPASVLKDITALVASRPEKDFDAIALSLQQAEQAVPPRKKLASFVRHHFGF